MWKWYAVAVVILNLWCAIWLGQTGLVKLLLHFTLANSLLLMTATDLKETMVYDIHFYVVLLTGVLGNLIQFNTLVPRLGFFLLLMGVFFLVSRRREELSAGDSRMIAVLALYYPFNEWMEVMLLALGSAMVYGIIGILRKKKTLKTQMPFMPFLLIGVLMGA